MTRSEWHGDKTNGIEFRYQAEFLDEVLMYIDGKCVFHLESMSEQSYWMGLYGKTHEAHVNIFSNNCRSHVVANAHGWEAKDAKEQQS